MLGELGTWSTICWPAVSGMSVQKNRQNPLILFKVTIDNVRVPFFETQCSIDTISQQTVRHTLNWALKVIQGHPYWCRQKYRTVCGRNVQLKWWRHSSNVRRYSNGKTAKSSMSATPSGLMTPRQETPSNIYKWFIFTETRVIDLYFAADSIGLSLLLFAQLSLEFEPYESKTASTKTEFYMK